MSSSFFSYKNYLLAEKTINGGIAGKSVVNLREYYMELKDNFIYLQIAGFNIKISFKKLKKIFKKTKIYRDLRVYKGFMLTEIPLKIDYKIDFIDKNTLPASIINITNKTILSVKKKSRNEIITFYQIKIIQFQLLLREILQELLTEHKGFIIHGSANLFYNKVFLFLGPNGSGKSTLTEFLVNKYQPLADDSGIIKKEGSTFYFYQTPFIEKESFPKKTYKRYKIGKIFFIQKSDFFKAWRIKEKEDVLKNLLVQFWTDKNNSLQIKHVLEFVSHFNQFYYLCFAKNKTKLMRFFKNLFPIVD